jgi:hypothetical protein
MDIGSKTLRANNIQIRRERITLAEATKRSDRTNPIIIKENMIIYRSNTLHDPLNPSILKNPSFASPLVNNSI